MLSMNLANYATKLSGARVELAQHVIVGLCTSLLLAAACARAALAPAPPPTATSTAPPMEVVDGIAVCREHSDFGAMVYLLCKVSVLALLSRARARVARAALVRRGAAAWRAGLSRAPFFLSCAHRSTDTES